MSVGKKQENRQPFETIAGNQKSACTLPSKLFTEKKAVAEDDLPEIEYMPPPQPEEEHDTASSLPYCGKYIMI